MNTIRPDFVELIPAKLAPGVLYISERYRTASHLCPCGCGERVVTPLSPADWMLTCKGGRVSLSPSIGNWNYACRSHYWIRDNQIIWATALSPTQIARVQQRDQRDKVRWVQHRNEAKTQKSVQQAPPSQTPYKERSRGSLWRELRDALAKFLRALS